MTPGPAQAEADGSVEQVLVLVSAPWAGPSRPAPTVLRELTRRWGDALTTVLIEEPSDEVLEQWDIEVLPTWVLLRRPAGGHGAPPPALHTDRTPPTAPSGERADTSAPVPGEVRGVGARGELVALRGPWEVVRRLTGAQPKHVVDAEFGPSS